MIKKLLVFSLLLLAVITKAQTVTATYNFAATTSVTGVTDPTPIPAFGFANFGPFSAIGTSTASSAAGRFSFTNWGTGSVNGLTTYSTMTGSISSTQYYQVTITPNPTFTLNLNNITFTSQRSGTGIRSYAVRSSIDSYSTNLTASVGTNTNLSIQGTNEFYFNTDASTTAQVGSQITLSAPSFSAITTPVTFRFYGWNAEATTGTFSIDDVVFNGTFVTLPCTIPFSLTSTPNPVCAGATTSLNATSPGSSINWYTASIGGTLVGTSLSGGNFVFSPSSSATYFAEAVTTGSAACISASRSSITVSVSPLPVVSANSGSVCAGNSFTIAPSGATSYSYSGGSAIVTPTVNATYTITGANSAGCIGTAVSNVTVNAIPLPTVSVSSGSICSGNAFTLVATGASTYSYSNGSAVVTPTANTSYTVFGTSSAGCRSINGAVASVTVNATPVVIGNSGGVCTGGSYTIVPTGATSYTYSSGSAVVTPTTTTSYTVTGANAFGCQNTAVVTVTVATSLIFSVNSGSICSGKSFTISPSGASSYSFSSLSAIVSPTTTTTYTVLGVNTAGCYGTQFSTVTVNPTPIISVNSGTICRGSSFTMTPSGATSYSYSNGSSTVTPFAANVYNYTVTGTTSGCSSTAVSSLTVFATPTITFTPGSVCLGNSFTITPGGAFTYTFSSGSPIVTPTVSTTYTVSGTNTVGCTSTINYNVNVRSTPTVAAVSNSTLICAGESANLTASGAISYTWSTAATGSVVSVSPIVNTTYTVTGTGFNGCTNSSTITQNVDACIGLNQLNLEKLNINLYPNPSNGLVSVELTTITKVSIINSLGDILITDVLSAGKQFIDIRNQSTGIYFVLFNQNGKQQTVKLIKH